MPGSSQSVDTLGGVQQPDEGHAPTPEEQQRTQHLDELRRHIDSGVIPGGTTLHTAAVKAIGGNALAQEEEALFRSLEYILVILSDKQSTEFLYKEDALTLIDAGRADAVASNLDKFTGLDQTIALKLIEAGEGPVVVSYLDKFTGLDHQTIALKLIEAGEGSAVVFYLKRFIGLDQTIALKLIEAGESFGVTRNLDKFTGLDQTITLKLIEVGEINEVAFNLDKFTGLDQTIALKLIEAGKVSAVANNLYKINGRLDQTIALKLIEAGKGSTVAFNLDKFTGLDQTIALKLIEAGQGSTVARNLAKFTGLDQEIALKLMEVGEGTTVAFNLDKFTGLDHQTIALKLIEAGKGSTVIYHLKEFTGFDHQAVALKLIEAGEGYRVASNLTKFTGLDQAVAFKLIEAGEGSTVAFNLDNFTGLDHQTIALKLIEADQGSTVVYYLNEFTGLDHQAIALKLIEAGEGSTVAHNLDKFNGLDQAVAFKLIEAGEGSTVAFNLDNFTGLDHQTIALKIIEAGAGYGVARNLDKFAGLDHQAIALKLIEAGEGYEVASNLDKFAGLDQAIAYKIVHDGYPREVIENLNIFEGLDINDLVGYICVISPSLGTLSKLQELTLDIKPELRATIRYLYLLNSEHDQGEDEWVDDEEWINEEGENIENTLIEDDQPLNPYAGLDSSIAQIFIEMDIENAYDYLYLFKEIASEDLDTLSERMGWRVRPFPYDGTDVDKNIWYADMSYAYLSGGFDKNAIGSIIRTLVEQGYGGLHDASQWLSDFQIPERGVDVKAIKMRVQSGERIDQSDSTDICLIDQVLEKKFMITLFNALPELRARLLLSTKFEKGQSLFTSHALQYLYYVLTSTDATTGKPLYKSEELRLAEICEYIEDHPDIFDEFLLRDTTVGHPDSKATAHDKVGLSTNHRIDSDMDAALMASEIWALLQGDMMSDLDNLDDIDRAGQLLDDATVQKLKQFKIRLYTDTPISVILSDLKALQLRRRDWVTDAVSWLRAQSIIEPNNLRKSWKSRPRYIAESLKNDPSKMPPDSPSAILIWEKDEGLRTELRDPDMLNRLAENGLTVDDIMDERHREVRLELLRVMSSVDVVRAMIKLHKWREGSADNPQQILKPQTIRVAEKYDFTIHSKDSAAGFTIGEDTDCCMTIDGVSKSCIKVGYTKHNAGFLSLGRPGTKIKAQSFWWINKNQPDTLVLDNIEANRGHDYGDIISMYQDALTEIINKHNQEFPDQKITRVVVGTGYTDVNLGHLKDVEPVGIPLYISYSDAYSQKLLLDLSIKSDHRQS